MYQKCVCNHAKYTVNPYLQYRNKRKIAEKNIVRKLHIDMWNMHQYSVFGLFQIQFMQGILVFTELRMSPTEIKKHSCFWYAALCRDRCSCWVRLAFRHRGVGLDYRHISENDERDVSFIAAGCKYGRSDVNRKRKRHVL